MVIGTVVNVAKNVGGTAAKAAKAIGQSRVAVECGVSALAGVAGVGGAKLANVIADKSEAAIKNAEVKKAERHLRVEEKKLRMEEKRNERHLKIEERKHNKEMKKVEKTIKSWDGMSCEDLI